MFHREKQFARNRTPISVPSGGSRGCRRKTTCLTGREESPGNAKSRMKSRYKIVDPLPPPAYTYSNGMYEISIPFHVASFSNTNPNRPFLLNSVATTHPSQSAATSTFRHQPTSPTQEGDGYCGCSCVAPRKKQDRWVERLLKKVFSTNESDV
ncbi:hypothetical protein LXL04_027909 [Taraxacum kok-saghyz]